MLQGATPPRLSHEMLRRHTEMNEQHGSSAALVEQIQALTATHQQLAEQMQALIKVVADQHMARADNAFQALSPFGFTAAVALALLLGLFIAKTIP